MQSPGIYYKIRLRSCDICKKTLVTGRSLEITDLTVCPEGETSFILVNRADILTTGFEELKGIQGRFKTLEVQFYNEVIFVLSGWPLPQISQIFSNLKCPPQIFSTISNFPYILDGLQK